MAARDRSEACRPRLAWWSSVDVIGTDSLTVKGRSVVVFLRGFIPFEVFFLLSERRVVFVPWP